MSSALFQVLSGEIKGKALAKVNQQAFEEYNDTALLACPYCARCSKCTVHCTVLYSSCNYLLCGFIGGGGGHQENIHWNKSFLGISVFLKWVSVINKLLWLSKGRGYE